MVTGRRTIDDELKQELPILVIEDEAPFREGLIRILEKEGYIAQGAGSAEEALGLVNDYWVLVTDILLPGIDGIDFEEEVMKRDPSKWFILMTGWPEKRMKATQKGLPCSLFLEKPLYGEHYEMLFKTLDKLAYITGILQELTDLAEEKDYTVEHQERWLVAKDGIMSEMWDRFASDNESKKSIAVTIRMAIRYLSLIPSKRLELTIPTEKQLRSLAMATAKLGLENVSFEDYTECYRALETTNLRIGLEIPDLEEDDEPDTDE